MPAAMLMTRFAFGLKPEKRAASFICCGFTASTMHVARAVGLLRRVEAVDAMLVGEPPARVAVDLDRAQLAGGKAVLRAGRRSARRHVAAADEHHVHGDVHAAVLMFLRAPKIAVPMRTRVEPSAIGKLQVVRHAHRKRVELRTRFSAFRTGFSTSPIAARAFAPGSGIAIKPRRRRRGSLRDRDSRKRRNFLGATPLLLPRPKRSPGSGRSAGGMPAGRCSERRRAIFSLSTVCTQSKRSATSRVLLLCRGPIRCHSTPARRHERSHLSPRLPARSSRRKPAGRRPAPARTGRRVGLGNCQQRHRRRVAAGRRRGALDALSYGLQVVMRLTRILCATRLPGNCNGSH